MFWRFWLYIIEVEIFLLICCLRVYPSVLFFIILISAIELQNYLCFMMFLLCFCFMMMIIGKIFLYLKNHLKLLHFFSLIWSPSKYTFFHPELIGSVRHEFREYLLNVCVFTSGISWVFTSRVLIICKNTAKMELNEVMTRWKPYLIFM